MSCADLIAMYAGELRPPTAAELSVRRYVSTNCVAYISRKDKRVFATYRCTEMVSVVVMMQQELVLAQTARLGQEEASG